MHMAKQKLKERKEKEKAEKAAKEEARKQGELMIMCLSRSSLIQIACIAVAPRLQVTLQAFLPAALPVEEEQLQCRQMDHTSSLS